MLWGMRLMPVFCLGVLFGCALSRAEIRVNAEWRAIDSNGAFQGNRKTLLGSLVTDNVNYSTSNGFGLAQGFVSHKRQTAISRAATFNTPFDRETDAGTFADIGALGGTPDGYLELYSVHIPAATDVILRFKIRLFGFLRADRTQRYNANPDEAYARVTLDTQYQSFIGLADKVDDGSPSYIPFDFFDNTYSFDVPYTLDQGPIPFTWRFETGASINAIGQDANVYTSFVNADAEWAGIDVLEATSGRVMVRGDDFDQIDPEPPWHEIGWSWLTPSDMVPEPAGAMLFSIAGFSLARRVRGRAR
jgi:hypothetical protein